jgi:hypothetical protein
MDDEGVLARLRAGIFEPYQLGFRYSDSRLIAPVPERCVSLVAGPLRFLVEARHLDDAAVASVTDGELQQESETPLFDDHGGTVHVLGAADGLEYLRFDCFEDKPHYHYVNRTDGVTVTVRIDQHAEGDPANWAVSRLRERLPQMLEYAGTVELAQSAERQYAEIRGAIDEIQELLRQADVIASSERAGT